MDNNAIYFLNKLSPSSKTFVDVGANDGVTGSMTFKLEQEGWSGVLIEPNPLLINNLKSKRSSKLINCAISSSEKPLEFSIVSGPGNLHGLSRFDYSLEFETHVLKHSGAIEKKIVECRKLTSVLEQNEIPKNFAFLKVDVEGHELEVFKSLNFSLFSPSLIVAEDNTKDSNKSVRKYLKELGYVVVARIGTNNFYVKSENLIKFLPQYILATIKFIKWDLKRVLWKMCGKEFVSKHV